MNCVSSRWQVNLCLAASHTNFLFHYSTSTIELVNAFFPFFFVNHRAAAVSSQGEIVLQGVVLLLMQMFCNGHVSLEHASSGIV